MITEAELMKILPNLPAWGVVALLGSLLILRFTAMVDSVKGAMATYNEGRRQEIAAQSNIIAAGTEAVKISVAALKDAVATQVDSAVQQISALRAEYRAEIEALKERFTMEGTKKDEEIQKLKEEVARLKAENTVLKTENTQTKEKVKDLENQLRAKSPKKKLLQSDGDGNHPLPVAAGDK